MQGEGLLAVDHPGEVDAGGRVLDVLGLGGLGKGDQEGGRGDDIGVTGGASRLGIGVQRGGGRGGAGELGDLRGGDDVHRAGWVGASGEGRVGARGGGRRGSGHVSSRNRPAPWWTGERMWAAATVRPTGPWTHERPPGADANGLSWKRARPVQRVSR